MSLVAYDDSSSEEEKEEEEDKESSPLPQLPPQRNQGSMNPSSNEGPSAVPPPSLPSLDELPDAAFLLNSSSNQSPQNTSRKRQSNGNVIQPPQSKIPRGGQSTLVHPRNVHGRGPTTMLVPPQLSGRSNVVTEDIEKLFVNRRRSSTG